MADRIRRALPAFPGRSDREVLAARFTLAQAQDLIARELWTSDSGVFLDEPLPEPGRWSLLVVGAAVLACAKAARAGRPRSGPYAKPVPVAGQARVYGVSVRVGCRGRPSPARRRS